MLFLTNHSDLSKRRAVTAVVTWSSPPKTARNSFVPSSKGAIRGSKSHLERSNFLL